MCWAASAATEGMRLVLLRHAQAEAKDVRDDFHRRLTEKGREEAVRIGQALGGQGIRAQSVVSSPATRAMETAVLAAPGLGFDIHHIAAEPLAYEGGSSVLLDIARRRAVDLECLVMVGHNPGLRELGEELAGLEEWSLPKGSAAIFESDGAKLEAGGFRHVRDVAPD